MTPSASRHSLRATGALVRSSLGGEQGEGRDPLLRRARVNDGPFALSRPTEGRAYRESCFSSVDEARASASSWEVSSSSSAASSARRPRGVRFSPSGVRKIGRGQLERGAVREAPHDLDGGFPVGLLADDDRAVVVGEGGGDHLRGARAARCRRGRRAARVARGAPVHLYVWRPPLVHPVGEADDTCVPEERDRADGLREKPAGVVAEIEHDAVRPARDAGARRAG